MKEILAPSKTIHWCKSTLAEVQEELIDIEPLRVEASHRSFYRIHTSKRQLVLMESPPELERNDLFAALAEYFRQLGLPVAEIIAKDMQQGLFLLSDLGDVHLEALYGTPLEEEALQAAIDLLPNWGAAKHPAIEAYRKTRFYDELNIFSEWFTGQMLNLDTFTPLYRKTGQTLVDCILKQPLCCIHRDYHCRNLLYNNGQLAVVDFQDALQGPILYDIASLLRDCYYTFTEDQVDRWLSYFIEQTPALDGIPFEEIKTSFDWTAIQRQLKAIGIFARLHLRDDKATHLQYIPPLLARLHTLIDQYPEIRPLQTQLEGCMDAFATYQSNIQ